MRSPPSTAIFCRCFPHTKYHSVCSQRLTRLAAHKCEHDDQRMSGWANEMSPKVIYIYITVHIYYIYIWLYLHQYRVICDPHATTPVTNPELHVKHIFIAPGLNFWLRRGTFQRGPLLLAGRGIVDKVLSRVMSSGGGVNSSSQSCAIMDEHLWDMGVIQN